MTMADTQANAPKLAAVAIDLPSPVPGACWRALRGWLEDLQVEFEPTVTNEGLVGYAVRMRNALLGVGLGLRATGPVVSVTAVLCRGMDREQQALSAVDIANGRLTLGQLLYFPGPPAELTFYAAAPFDLLDRDTFALLFHSVLNELDNVGFAAVMQVRGYHPTDHSAPWGDPMLAPLDDDDADAPASPTASADVASGLDQGDQTETGADARETLPATRPDAAPAPVEPPAGDPAPAAAAAGPRRRRGRG